MKVRGGGLRTRRGVGSVRYVRRGNHEHWHLMGLQRFELRTPAGLAHWRRFLTEAAILVVKYGGSLSGEHGDGQSHAELLPKMFGPELV